MAWTHLYDTSAEYVTKLLPSVFFNFLKSFLISPLGAFVDIVKQWIGKLSVYAAKNAPEQQKKLTIILICLEKMRHFHASLNIKDSRVFALTLSFCKWLGSVTNNIMKMFMMDQPIKSTDMLPTDSMYVGHMVMLVNKYELPYHHVLSVVSGHIFLHLARTTFPICRFQISGSLVDSHLTPR